MIKYLQIKFCSIAIFTQQIMQINKFFLIEIVTEQNSRSQDAKLIEIFTNWN